MDIAWSLFTPWHSLAGGALIGLAASLLLLGNGQIAGISGILGNLLTREGRAPWRLAFLAGMVLSPLLLWPVMVEVAPATVQTPNIDTQTVARLLVGGFLVGLGTRLANGCTSGHGVCGLARFSLRSLVAVIAHELAHSWSGNLVTNATWGDLWLNEGFTVYFERRILEQIYGAERASIEAVIGKHELVEELNDPDQLGDKPEFQKLAQNLRGIDPDESFSGVPYEKGALLLVSLEQAYGREVFDVFLHKRFSTHAFGSVSTPEFRSFVKRELFDAHPVLDSQNKPDLDAWIDQPGLPESAPDPESDVLAKVADGAKDFAAGKLAAKEIKPKGWTALSSPRAMRGTVSPCRPLPVS